MYAGDEALRHFSVDSCLPVCDRESKVCINLHLTSPFIYSSARPLMQRYREHKSEWLWVILTWFTTHIKIGIYYISNSIWEERCQHFPCHLQWWEGTGMDGNAFSNLTLSDSPVTSASTHTRASKILWLDTNRGVLNLILLSVWEMSCPTSFTVE